MMSHILWLANCYFAHDSSGFLVLLRHLHSILKELELKDAELY
jgi:hypothetical protein